MKQRKSTDAMRTGTKNEEMIQTTIANFLEKHADIHTIEAQGYGLVKNRNERAAHIATYPDMIGAIYESNEKSGESLNSCDPRGPVAVAYEFKTIFAEDKLAEASAVR